MNVDRIANIGDTTINPMWHSTALQPEAEVIMGNAGGKCRALFYQALEDEIVSDSL